jgi:predicted ester cyclase
MADNATLIRSLYDAWNAQNFEAGADAMAPDGTITLMGTGETFTGPDGARKFGKMLATGFPDGTITVDTVVSEGDRVVVEYTCRGTHTGPVETSTGVIQPTGKSVTLKVCDVDELKDGKVTAQRTYLDTGSMMAQLGLMREQTETATQ